MDKATDCDIEALLQSPYWVIDFLPAQVPASSEGQFFAVESNLLAGQRHLELRRRFANVLLMLNCYHDFLVLRGKRSHAKANPLPEKLEKWVLRNREDLSIVIPSEQALITLTTDGTHMTLYNPSRELLKKARLIATANGLFVRRPITEE